MNNQRKSSPKRHLVAAIAGLTALLLFLSLITRTDRVLAQADVKRQTTAIRYPLDKDVTVKFRGTTRFPNASGQAVVKRSNANGTTIELSVSKMPPPYQLGAGYTTYVLWAVEKYGYAENLAEIKPHGALEFDAKIRAKALSGSFALLVTAEPHFLVQRPSQAVMLENLAPSTTDNKKIVTFPVSYVCRASGYFGDRRTPRINETDVANTPSKLLQARQAFALAKYSGAERYAVEDFDEAELLTKKAEKLWQERKDPAQTDIAALYAIYASSRTEEYAVLLQKERISNSFNRPQMNASNNSNRPNWAANSWSTNSTGNFTPRPTPKPMPTQITPSSANANIGSVGELLTTTTTQLGEQIAELKAELAEKQQKGELNSHDAESLITSIRYKEYRLSLLSGDPRPDSDPSTVRLSRYPTVETKNEVVKNEKFAVQVSLTGEQLTSDVKVSSVSRAAEKEEGGKVGLILPNAPDVNEWELEVVLSAASGDFTFVGPNTSTITLPRVGDSTPARFDLVAKAIPEAERRSKISAAFYFKKTGAFLVKVEREITIRQETVSANPASPERRAPISNVVSAPAVPKPAPASLEEENPAIVRLQAELAAVKAREANNIAFSFKDVPPDMTIKIRTNIFDRQTANSHITITSPHLKNTIRQAEFSTPADMSKFIDAKFREFSSRSARDVGVFGQGANVEQTTPALMRGFGESFYDDHAPELFKKTFWELRDRLGGKFKTILIITDNPNVPWELMRPRRDSNSPAVEFLGLEYDIGRLHDQSGKTVGDTQPQKTSVSGMTVIAPTYQAAQALPLVKREVDFLKTLTVFDDMDGVRRVEGQFEKLQILFASMPSHIIHFAGHGKQRTDRNNIANAAISLGDTDLNADAWRGLISRGGQNRPFFFMNACEVGRSGNFSGFVDGFAPVVLDAGASGYIGALWSIGDKGAQEFAELFYKTMSAELATKGSVSMADLMRITKREYLKNNDLTFLAYIFYGDPNLRLVFRKPEQASNKNIVTDSANPGAAPTPSPAPTPPSTNPVPRVLSGGVLNGRAIDLVKPKYPAKARKAKASGVVNVQMLIDEDGNVVSATAVSGHPLLRKAAEEAARNSTFDITMISGVPVRITGVLVFYFAP